MTILITGGASGLGEAITRKLAENAANQVFFTYAKSAGKAKIIEGEFPNCKGIHCDFTDAASIQKLKEKLADINPDTLINNAYSGTFIGTYFHKTETSDFLKEFQVSVMGTVEITQAAITLFRKKKYGKIITILTSALIGNPPMGTAMYVANKAYLQKLAMVWAAENTRFNITSNCISPAFMQTDFTASLDERLVEQIKDSHPLKELLQPEEVAKAVAYLLDAGQQVNGTDLVINAGTSLK